MDCSSFGSTMHAGQPWAWQMVTQAVGGLIRQWRNGVLQKIGSFYHQAKVETKKKILKKCIRDSLTESNRKILQSFFKMLLKIIVMFMSILFVSVSITFNVLYFCYQIFSKIWQCKILNLIFSNDYSKKKFLNLLITVLALTGTCFYRLTMNP